MTTSAQQTVYTRDDVEALYAAWCAAQDAPTTFDEAISEPLFTRSRNAHTAYRIALAGYLNVPYLMPSQDDMETLNAYPAVSPLASSTQPAQADPSTPAPSAAASDMAAVGGVDGTPAPQAGETVSPSTDESAEAAGETLRSTVTSSRLSGRVKRWYTDSNSGYITGDDGREVYSRGSSSLMYANMPVKAGDRVTFDIAVSVAITSSMPRAVRVLVEGYTPPETPAYTPSVDVVKAAKDMNARERAHKKAWKRDRRMQDAANKQAMRDLFNSQK